MVSALTTLIDLVAAIARALPQKQIFVDTLGLEKTKGVYARMFQALMKEEVRSDEALSVSVLGIPASDKQYQVHRSQFKQLLLNNLIGLDLKAAGFSDYGQETFKSDREVFVCRVLQLMGAYVIANDIGVKALQRTIHCELWQNALDLLPQLRSLAAMRGDLASYDRYSKELARIEIIAKAERDALERYERVVMEFAAIASEKPEAYPKVLQHAIDTEHDFLRHRTFNLALASFRLHTAAAQIVLNYSESLKRCDEFSERLRNEFSYFATPFRLVEVATKRLLCYVQLRDHDNGLRAAEECRTLIAPESNPWFNFKDYEFLLLMHSQNFTAAQRALKEVTTSNKFDRQPEYRKERWEVYALYLGYVQHTAKPVRDVADLKDRIPLLTKDKAGFNIAILILHVLLLLDARDFTGVIDRIEAIRNYRKRLHKSSPQTDEFLRLLYILEKCDFSPDAAEKMGVETLVLLRSTTEDLVDGQQILPYDWIWNEILCRLRSSASRDQETVCES